MNLEDLRVFLPKFLSSESDRELYNSLKSFPDNIDSRFYTNYLEQTDLVYQGDGLNEMLIINLPDPTIKPAPGIVLSNTCDIDLKNIRNFPSQIVYSPIFKLEKYETALRSESEKSSAKIDAHISAIRKQEITQIFFLPKLEGRIEDSIVFFDRVCNISNKSVDRTGLKDQRIFTLSDYGAYLFLFKMSVHFNRIQDKIERKTMNP